MLNRRFAYLTALVALALGLAAVLGTTTGGAGSIGQSAALVDPASFGDGPAPEAFSRPPQATDAPLAQMPQLARDVRRIATARHNGVERALYLGKDSEGMTCVIIQEGPLGSGGGGCNPSRNPFHGSQVMWSSGQYNEDPQKLVLFGVVTKRVSALTLTFDGGVETSVPVSEDDGFIYSVAKPVIAASDVPRAIKTFDSKGRLIEQTDLGITFGP